MAFKELLLNSKIASRNIGHLLFQLVFWIPYGIPIVATIGHPSDGVNVILCGLRIFEKYTRVVVKLEHNYWTLNTVVKGICMTKASNPAKIGLVEMSTDLAQAGGSCFWREVDDKFLHDLEK